MHLCNVRKINPIEERDFFLKVIQRKDTRNCEEMEGHSFFSVVMWVLAGGLALAGRGGIF
ncbi:MAG: hypothetical protein DA408_14745 [Bacteroidetes bacterium]|nr:MAG: hypothetical protein C7N36_05370 [Bacteroidota bacterium]PTM10960.1 MAG: hypothetical protein DA408_14745 [Bacteroidota bacterium]